MDIKNKVEVDTQDAVTFDTREQFIEDYNQCPLCGTELLFTHLTHFVDGVVTEEAVCTACKVQTRKAQHKLQ